MKILAIERECLGVSAEQFQPHLKLEAARLWELYQNGQVREAYFHADQHTAVLVLECLSAEEAGEILQALPLVEAGLITFELLPLIPYNGYARLFEVRSS